MTIPHQNPAAQRALDDIAFRVIVKCLRDHGWSNAGGVALASKPFKTVVGGKSALAYLEIGSYNYVLKGDYQSEGRNQLEPHGVLIPKPDEPEPNKQNKTSVVRRIFGRSADLRPCKCSWVR